MNGEIWSDLSVDVFLALREHFFDAGAVPKPCQAKPARSIAIATGAMWPQVSGSSTSETLFRLRGVPERPLRAAASLSTSARLGDRERCDHVFDLAVAAFDEGAGCLIPRTG